jgi:phage host-nuclease inhibitor protein Gam
MTTGSINVVFGNDDVAQEEGPAVPEQFYIHDDVTANWLVRKIVEARAYVKHCDEWCAREQARARREEEFLLFRFGQQLLDHARKRISEQGGRRKSLNLPAGTIGFRRDGPKLLIDDEAKVIEWAKRNKPELVRSVEHLSKAGLNQHLEETGEAPDVGVHIEPAREKFYVK